MLSVTPIAGGYYRSMIFSENRCPLFGMALFAHMTGRCLLDLLQDLAEVVALGSLQRRELLERLQVLQPQLLPDRQDVPVVLEGRYRAAERTAEAHRRLLVDADRLLEGITLEVVDQGEVERDERHDPAGRPGLRHGVVHLPVLIAHCRWRCAGVIEEEV